LRFAIILRGYIQQLSDDQQQNDLQNAPVQRLVSGESGVLFSRMTNTIHRLPVVDDAACDVRHGGHVFCTKQHTIRDICDIWYDTIYRDLTYIWFESWRKYIARQYDMQLFHVT